MTLAAVLQELPGVRVRVAARREGRTLCLQRLAESGVRLFPLTGGFDKGGPQVREPRDDLSMRPFRTVTGALARGTGLLQPFGLLSEPHCPLQVSGMGTEVLVEGAGGPNLGVCSPDGSGSSASGGTQSSQRLFQAWAGLKGLQEMAQLRRSEGW